MRLQEGGIFMIKELITLWEKNKATLRNDILANELEYRICEYFDIVDKVVKIIFNNNGESDKWQSGENITEIDNGDYQGTLLYMIPMNSYQPSESEYALTTVYYGSCSACDSLQSAQNESLDVMADDIMTMALHLVQKTIIPYKEDYIEYFD